ncbi:MAG: hypothetical protein LBJ17_07645 [Dysgonamonadaceae bacterium]|nr:hypothetical protein [Dysgonamonadaceae bacterium]
MKKIFLLTAFALYVTFAVNAQVTVGSLDNPSATLDIVGDSTDATKPDGLLPPRVNATQLTAKTAYSDQQNGAIVFVTNLPAEYTPTAGTKTAKVNKPGYYYYDAGKQLWIPINTGASWYYLPSTMIDVRRKDPVRNDTLDIFNAYMEQVAQTNDWTGGSPQSANFPKHTIHNYHQRGFTIKSSATAPYISEFLTWETALTRDQFYYYVIGFDERVFDKDKFQLADTGADAGMLIYQVIGNADDATFINIIIAKK